MSPWIERGLLFVKQKELLLELCGRTVGLNVDFCDSPAFLTSRLA